METALKQQEIVMVRKLVIAVLTAVTSVASFSESCYWQKYNGTYEGLFSESGRWTPKVPGAADNVYARSENKEDSRIILDGDYTIGYLCLDKGSFKLDGIGSLTETSGTYKHINPGYTLELCGSVWYNASKANQYESYGTLRLAGGGMVTQKYVPGPLTEVCGGAFTNSSAKYAAASVCRVSSGDYRCTSSLTFAEGAVLTVTGGRVSAASGVTFDKGSMFALTNAVLDIGKATFAAGSSIRLGEGAELRLSLTSTIKTADIEADPTAKIVFVVPDGTAAARSCPVWLPVGGELAGLGVKIEVEGPAGWTGKMIGPCYFITGGVETAPSKTYEWTGAADGYWSNGENWHGGIAPTQTAAGWVYISGERQTVITNDIEGLTLKGINIRSGTAPVVIRGKPIKLSSTTTGYNNEITLRSDSSFPVVFENEIVFATQYGYSSERNSSAAIEHRGGVSQTSTHGSRFIWYYGKVAYGGTAKFRRLLTNYAGDAPLTFLPDADYTLTEQVEGPANHGMNASLTYGGKLTMMTGSKLTVNGPWCQAANASSEIDGLLDFQGTLRGAQHWYGTGTVKTSGKYYTDAAATNNVSIGKGMTLVPSSWNTEPAPGVVYRICATNGISRIKAAGDWTYGPAEGAADNARELHIATGSTLVIDTEEAESGKGCTVTFVDPLAAEGSLVKDGAGTLKLPYAAVTVEGRLALNEGVLHLSAPVTVAGEFTAGDDAALSFVGDILGGERMRTVLTASSISSVPSVKGPYILKKIANAEDSTESLLLMRSGMTVILR